MDKSKNKEEIDMNAIAQRITASPAASPAEMAVRIKQEAPTLADLAPDQLEMIARLVMTQRLTAEMNTAVNLAGIDWQKEKAVFLDNAGHGQSTHTRRGYSNALSKLEAWAAGQGINPLELTPAQADDFIYSLKASGAASATVRLTTASASSFYTFLHRRHKEIENPFRGSKARPKEKAVRPLVIPSALEVETIIRELPPIWAAAVSLMAGLGLRCGALPELAIKGERFTSNSKGKDIAGNIPVEITERVKAASLPLREPFVDRTANSIELAIAYHIKKLFLEGKIGAAYSAHDFRHHFAVIHYRKYRDIYALQRALNHASIAITERYLRGIGEL
jgi:site-specific recombinase XerD